MRRGCKKKRRALLLRAVLACAGLACGQCAWAQDAGLDVSQYAHTAWKVRDGFVRGVIFAIAQTPDGYLWLGTELGLYRFDGVRALPWQPPNGEELPSNNIRDLLVARDGTLWIGTWKGLASWKDSTLTQYPEFAGRRVGHLLQDRDGTVWVAVSEPGSLCSIQGQKLQCYGAGSLGSFALALYEDHDGNLWVTAATGLWRWKPGPPKQYAFPQGAEINSLIEDKAGTLLLATSEGLKQLSGRRIQNYAVPNVTGRFRPHDLLRSNDDSLWITTTSGLLHLHQGRSDTFGMTDGLSGDSGSAIFEDREGNIWVSTLSGLDRFHDYAVRRISTNQGLSVNDAYSIQATQDGAIWIGTSDRLNRLKNGHVTVYDSGSRRGLGGRKDDRELNIGGAVTKVTNSGLEGTPQSLGLDGQGRLCVSTKDGVFYSEGNHFVRVPSAPGGNIWSVGADGHGKLWINDGTAGLFYFTRGEAVQPIPWSRFGQKGFGPESVLADRSNGGLWLGFNETGISYFEGGQVRASYTAANGLGNGRVNDLRFGSRGALWAATEGGLSRIKDGHIMTLTSKNGLPCDTVHWSVEDDDHFVWLYMPCGLARVARSELDAWVSDPSRKLKLTIFDNADGVTSLGSYGGYGPRVTKSPDGKIWFVTYGGVSVIDPQHLAYNKVPPPVQVEQITADRKNYGRTVYGNMRVPLPPLSRDLEIDYTALSLAVPEKVRFRYKLEGRDRDWVDAGNRRQAFYSDLPPRNYRFRVMACNNSGVWNEDGAFLDFSIAPAYYQTNWFRALCVAAFLALLWALYELRLRGIQREFNMGLEERLKERTRIARELHDTLLQNLHGLLFRFQAARNLFPRRPQDAMETLDEAIAKTEQAITESQDAITDLRPSPAASSDLGGLLMATGKELETTGNGNGTAATFALTVEGERQIVSPSLQDEVYRIALELLRNAFRHSSARRVEAEVRYDDEQLRVRIRDDGKGMDPEVLKKGRRPGHWGLLGAKERAERIGARLEIWSEAGAGTEIQISVPAAVAYKNSHDKRRFSFFRGVRS